MKTLRFLFLSIALMAALHAKHVPTPEMAMGFAINKDPQKWVPQFMDGDKTGIIFEFVPDGQSINSWNEMVAQQIAFTKESLRKHVDDWKAMLLKADPKIEIKEEDPVIGFSEVKAILIEMGVPLDKLKNLPQVKKLVKELDLPYTL